MPICRPCIKAILDEGNAVSAAGACLKDAANVYADDLDESRADAAIVHINAAKEEMYKAIEIVSGEV